MKTMNMISRRSFLKAALAASAVSAMALTGAGPVRRCAHRLRRRCIQHRFQRCRFHCRRF